MGTVNPSLESSTLQPGNTNQPYAMSAIRRIIHTNLAPAAIGPYRFFIINWVVGK